ncbi:MAG: hypothetical protein PHS17_16860, partial [Desulfobacterales bacterium]|nr:hypothetical protein [Desulfobacterales bacterium]
SGRFEKEAGVEPAAVAECIAAAYELYAHSEPRCLSNRVSYRRTKYETYLKKYQDCIIVSIRF